MCLLGTPQNRLLELQSTINMVLVLQMNLLGEKAEKVAAEAAAGHQG
jgi:SNF2 family DNA or RNA helicase